MQSRGCWEIGMEDSVDATSSYGLKLLLMKLFSYRVMTIVRLTPY